MKPIHIGTSPLTNPIFAGHVLKNGCWQASGKQDVTGSACAAVAQHVLARGQDVIVTENGKPKYAISVQLLDQTKAEQ